MNKIKYHIVLYDETCESPNYPHRDCRHEVSVRHYETYNDFIDSIIAGLRKYPSYNDIRKYINKHRNNLIIKIFTPADTQADLLKQKVINYRYIVNVNDMVDITYALNNCVYFIGGIKKENKIKTESRKKKPKAIRSKTINKKKHHNTKPKAKRNKKRKRIQIENENDIKIAQNNKSNTKATKPPSKRRKKIKLILSPSKSIVLLTPNEKEYECLWVLTEATPSLSGEYQQNTRRKDKINKINKVNKVRECIVNIIDNNWIKQDCPTHYISLYSFGKSLNEETKPLYYCNENKTLILDCFDNIKLCNTKSMIWTNAMIELINIIACNKDNIKCGTHRIVLFCGSHVRTKLNVFEKTIVNDMKSKLLKLNIIFDCIQISHSYRPNGDINKIANKYWSSIQNDVVLCHDFVYPNKRNMDSKQDAVVID